MSIARQFLNARRMAREIHVQVWKRRAELWDVPPTRVVDILPMPLELIATRLLKLHVSRLPEINGEIAGSPTAGIWIADEQTIIISEAFHRFVIAFTLAHEIGHAVLHPTLTGLHRDRPLDGGDHRRAPRRDFREREADHFAAGLLMPTLELETTFRNLYGGPISGSKVDEKILFYLRTKDGEHMEAAAFAAASRRQRALWFAENTSVDGLPVRPLTDLFGVSATAMAIELEDLGFIE